MRTVLSVGIGLLLLSSLHSYAGTPPDTLWGRTIGGPGGESPYSIDVCSDGGFVITGNKGISGTYDSYLTLVRADANGNEMWTKNFGDGIGNHEGASVRQTSDGGFVITGYTDPEGWDGDADVWLVKTDSDGVESWSYAFGGKENDFGQCVEQTSDGGYIVCGYTQSFGDSAQFYLIKTDDVGIETWSRTFGSSQDEIAYSVRQTPDGGYIIVGDTADGFHVLLVKTDANGIETWSRSLGLSSSAGRDLELTADGGYIITGTTDAYGEYHGDILLLKTDSDGYEEWVETIGGPMYDMGRSIQIAHDGGYVIAGWTEAPTAGGFDVYIVKADASGEEMWTKTLGGSAFDWANEIKQTADGGFVIVGSTESYGAGNGDIWLIRLETELQSSVAGSGAGVPEGCSLHPGAPNPFNPTTSIRFDLQTAGYVRLTVHDLAGRRITTLSDEYFPSGTFTRIWNGTDDTGVEVGSGVYFIRLNAGNYRMTNKVTLVR